MYKCTFEMYILTTQMHKGRFRRDVQRMFKRRLKGVKPLFKSESMQLSTGVAVCSDEELPGSERKREAEGRPMERAGGNSEERVAETWLRARGAINMGEL